VSTFPIDLDPLALPNPPQPEPLEIRAGDTVQWERACDDYPPSQGYMLSYVFVCRTANYLINGSMVVAGPESFVVKIPAATTAGWTAGWYRWQAYISDGSGNRFTVGEGKAEVLPNLQVATGGMDDREPDEITLDNINLLIAGKATQDVKEYKVFEREIQRYEWKELLQLKSVYEQRVRALRIRRGEKPLTKTIGVSFGYGY
jgi:hypothetical protein